MFDINERPTTLQLQVFCNRFGTGTSMRKKLAESIGMVPSTFDDYYYGKRGRRMPAPSWGYLRITWDALLHAEWHKQRPQHE
jgi:hypothetical protein